MRRVVSVLIASSVLAQIPVRTPLADFDERVAAYMKIRKAAEANPGRLSPTSSSEQLDTKARLLAGAILTQRTGAAQGDIFTPAIAAEFKKLIALSLKQHPIRIHQSIRSGEVVNGKVGVNQSYPQGVPVETMPPSLLANLPKLPPELDYRLVGSALVLRDANANLILDLIPNAIATH